MKKNDFYAEEDWAVVPPWDDSYNIDPAEADAMLDIAAQNEVALQDEITYQEEAEALHEEDIYNSLPKSFSGKILFDRLQTYKELNNLTVEQLCKKLGWHYQQLYALNDSKRTVRAKLLTHVITKLGISPNWLLASGKEYSYVQVLKLYPPKVLEWLISEEGRTKMLEAYAVHSLKKEQERISNDAQVVYEAQAAAY